MMPTSSDSTEPRPSEAEASCDTSGLGVRDIRVLDDLEALVAKRLQYIRLTQRFAEIANAAESIEDGLSDALACFCRELGWPIGHAFLATAPGASTMVDSGAWWFDDGLDAGPLVEATEMMIAAPGEDFIGRVIATGEAQWIGEDVADVMTLRRDAARRLDLKCGIAFPILVRSIVVGVLEFLSHDLRVCERELLDAVGQLGTQLGRIIERVDLERELARVSQEQRRELGRALHDTLSQQLTGIGMLARSLERKLAEEGHVQHDRSRSLVEGIDEAREQLRKIAQGLDPVQVDAEEMRDRLEAFAETTARAFGVECRVEAGEPLDLADDFVAEQLYHIVCEATHNAAKHADASLVTIETGRAGNARELRVRDDGTGFDPHEHGAHGMGLRTLRYRARLIGARLRIDSAPGEGTTVTCTLLSRGQP